MYSTLLGLKKFLRLGTESRKDYINKDSMWCCNNNLNKVRLITIWYIEILFKVVFIIRLCIPDLHWVGNHICARVDKIQSGINLHRFLYTTTHMRSETDPQHFQNQHHWYDGGHPGGSGICPPFTQFDIDTRQYACQDAQVRQIWSSICGSHVRFNCG